MHKSLCLVYVDCAFHFLRKTHDHGCDFTNKEVEPDFSFCFLCFLIISTSFTLTFKYFFSFCCYTQFIGELIDIIVQFEEEQDKSILFLNVDNSLVISQSY